MWTPSDAHGLRAAREGRAPPRPATSSSTSRAPTAPTSTAGASSARPLRRRRRRRPRRRAARRSASRSSRRSARRWRPRPPWSSPASTSWPAARPQGARVEDHVAGARASRRWAGTPPPSLHLDSPIVSRLHARLTPPGRRRDRRGPRQRERHLRERPARRPRSEVAPGDLLVVGPFQLVVDRARDRRRGRRLAGRRARHPRPRPPRRPRGHGARGRARASSRTSRSPSAPAASSPSSAPPARASPPCSSVLSGVRAGRPRARCC